MKEIIVVHSGGMDSSICLAQAVSQFGADKVLAISFSYGQRHETPELNQAQKIADYFQVERKVIPISSLKKITTNALLDHQEKIEVVDEGPNTLVVGRNGLMARLAAIHADSLGVSKIVMGIIGIEAANSGYRDCTREYMDMMEGVLKIDLANPDFKILTPLVDMTKLETMELAHKLGELSFLLENTISCYEGIAKEGCMKCPACSLRNEGIRQFAAQNNEFSISYLEKITQFYSTH